MDTLEEGTKPRLRLLESGVELKRHLIEMDVYDIE
jgi:hypothetical protein